jgi:hypothetical protein
MDMIVNKNNSKSTDLKYIFELQKSNYNEIKMSTTDINLAMKTLIWLQLPRYKKYLLIKC